MSNEDLLNAPSLVDQFPISFQNGFKINTLLFWCPSCKTNAPLAKVHGHISRIVDGVADIYAAMKCSCGRITNYRIRLRDDRSFSYLNDNQWVHQTLVVPFKRRVINRIKLKILVLYLKWQQFQLLRQVRKLQGLFKDRIKLR